MEAGKGEKVPSDSGEFTKVRSVRSGISLEFKERDEFKDDEDNRYSQDCYSFIALGCGKGNRLAFAYATLVFIFQMVFLVLMICSKMVRSMSANEDVDNAEKDNENYVFAQFIPANSSIIVKITQFMAIMAFLLFAEDSVNDVVAGVRYFPLPLWSTEKMWVRISCIFRIIQGVSSCFTALLLVLVSSDVIEIVLNFTAVNFISSLDDAAFEIAKSGHYGNTLKKKATDIEENICVDYKCLHHLKDQEVIKKDETGEDYVYYRDKKYTWYIPTLSIIATILLGITIYVIHSQQSEKWIAQTVRVEFDEDSGLIDYSGCYYFEGRNDDRRPKYTAKFNAHEGTLLEYCQADRRWVFAEDGGAACGNQEVGKHLAQSAKTNAFDVSTAFELSWVSPFKKPLDMYFIDSTTEAELFCQEFLGDGKCDANLNNNDFKWDGGDCCGMTCNHPDCGVPSMNKTTVFGDEVTSDMVDFPSCQDTNMVDVTFVLGAHDFKESIESMWMTFWNPNLKLVCGDKERIVFDISVTQSMFGESHTVQVEYGTACTLTIRNFEPYFDSFGASFSVHQYITVDSDNTGVNVDALVKNSIPNRFASLEDVTSLDLSGNYTLQGTIPTEIGSLPSLMQLVLRQSELSGRIPKQIGSLVDLTNLDLSGNLLSGTIPIEITTLTGLSVVSLGDNFLKGKIPTEIGLLKELVTLDLRNNQLSGLIPTEIQSLPKLKFLFLDENKLKGYVRCRDFENIWNVEDCQSINSFPRWDSESPTTSPAPSFAPSISNAPSVSNAPTSSFKPTSNTTLETHIPSSSPSLSPSDPPPECFSIGEILCQENEFVQMCELMRAVDGAEDMLSNKNETFTVFAPTNIGISRYYTDNGVKFNFEDVFWFHIVEEEDLFEVDLPCDAGLNLITMSNGKDSRTLCDRKDHPIGQKGYGNEVPIPFVAFDMEACNGVIHTISDVLLSPETAIIEP